MFLVVCKGKEATYGEHTAVWRVETMALVEQLTGEKASSIAWQLKRTGRWDSEDLVWAVFPSEPQED